MDKYQHVREAKQTRPHTCHWPGCERQVKPAEWGCRGHWFRLPWILRRKIWEHYKPGQEESLRVTSKYLEVAQEAQEWIKLKGGD